MSEQAQKPDMWKFKALVFVLAGGLVSLLAAALSVGGLAWLLDLTGLGLSADARFTIATVIFCSLFVSLTTVVVGAFIIMSHTFVNSSTNPPGFEDPAYAEEQDEEELDLEDISRMAYFKYLMARTTGRVMDGFPELVEVPDDLSTQPHYRRTNSTKPHKRRRTNRK